MKKGKAWIAVLVIVLAAVPRLYFVFTAPFESSQVDGKLSVYNDEPAHRSVVMYWMKEGHHPSRGVNPQKPIPVGQGNIVARTSEDYQPPLYYILGSTTFRLGELLRAPEPWIFLRLLSVIFGMVSLWFLWLNCRYVLSEGESIAALAFGGVLLSQVRFTSLVTNDSLLWAISAAVFYLILRRSVNRVGWFEKLGLIALLVAGLWTKASFLPLVFVLPIIWILGIRPNGNRGFPWMEVVIPLICWVPWIMWNHTHWGTLLPVAVGFGAPVSFFTGLEKILATVIYAFRSFWFPFDDIWGGGFRHVLFVGLGILGLIVFVLSVIEICRQFEMRKLFPVFSPELKSIIVCMVSFGLLLLSYLALNYRYFQSEARLLFPAFVPIVMLLSLGTRRLARGVGPWLLPVMAAFSYSLFL